MKKETNHILTKETIKNFIFAGNATFTVLNETTGNRFTFRIRKAGWNTSEIKHDTFFISVLTGSDNNSSYTFLGTFFNKFGYKHSIKSRIGLESGSNKVIDWFFKSYISNMSLYPTVKVFHSGKCGKCGKKLTTPESVKSGLGPYCKIS